MDDSVVIIDDFQGRRCQTKPGVIVIDDSDEEVALSVTKHQDLTNEIARNNKQTQQVTRRRKRRSTNKNKLIAGASGNCILVASNAGRVNFNMDSSEVGIDSDQVQGSNCANELLSDPKRQQLETNGRMNLSIQQWYEKYRLSPGYQLRTVIYSCPECQKHVAGLMHIRRHMQLIHPKSIHRYRCSTVQDTGNSTICTRAALEKSCNVKKNRSSSQVSDLSQGDKNGTKATYSQSTSTSVSSDSVIQIGSPSCQEAIREVECLSSTPVGNASCVTTNIMQNAPVLITLADTSSSDRRTTVTVMADKDKFTRPNNCTNTSELFTFGRNAMPGVGSHDEHWTKQFFNPELGVLNGIDNDNSSTVRDECGVRSGEESNGLIQNQKKKRKRRQKIQVDALEARKFTCPEPGCSRMFPHEARFFQHLKDRHKQPASLAALPVVRTTSVGCGKKKKRKLGTTSAECGKTTKRKHPASPSKHRTTSAECGKKKKRKHSASLSKHSPHQMADPPSMEKLRTMRHIILVDIDNWQKIFESDLPFTPCTFVWGFYGGSTSWLPPINSPLLKRLREGKCFHIHPKCGKSKDAADFALCVQAGKLDALLPKEIPFTVLSGDTGFRELHNQLSLSKREVHIVDPHKKSLDTVLAILNSIAEK